MRKKWLGLIGLLVLAAPQIRAQMTAVSAAVQDANGQHYVNCSWSVVFVGQNTIPGAGPYQPQALLVGQQGECDSSGNLRVTLADNVNTITPTPSQWNFSICSAPGYVPGGTFCRSNMLVTITGQAQDLTAFFQPLMPLLPPGGGGGGGTQYITDATPLMGLMRTGTTLGLQTTCVVGQYLGWNGSAWACTGAGVGGGTTVTVNGTAAIPNILNFNNTSPLPPAGSQNVTFQLNGNSVSAYVPAGGGGGGGTGFTVNGTTPTGVVNFNASNPLPPPNGINVNWTLVGTNLTAAIVGDGNPNSCLLGTGLFAACPGGGGGSGTPLPTIPQYNLFASTGAGAAQDSTIKAGPPGFLQAEVITATGDITSAPAPFQLFPNSSVEYFPNGYAWSGGTAGAAHGFAGYFSHSAGTTAAANGGIGLGGGNSSGVGNQIYLDCEAAPTAGCDFKVPVTYLGTAIGGGGGGSGTVSSGTAGHFTWYAAAGTTVSSNANLDDDLTTPSTITSQEPIAAPQINVNGAVGTGIAMTGAGGTLPTPALGQGGIGIGPGNVPMYSSNGGAWTAIGSGSGGATLPSCATSNCVLASNAAGTAAVDTGVKASGGFIQSGASIVNGTAAGSPFTGGNASQEFYGVGGAVGSVTFANGAALFMGHSNVAGVGGIALGGGNNATTQQIYLDCEVAGCDFKVPVTQGGNPIGGSSGGGTIATTSANSLLAYYPGTWVASASYLVNSIIRDSNNNLQRVTTAGTSGASAPSWSTTLNATTNDGTTLVWTLIQVGSGSTTVVPVPAGAFASFFQNGLSFGSGGVLQWGTSATAVDTGLTRVAPGVAAVGTGGQTSTAGYLYGANSCTITSPATFSGSQTLCQRLLPSSTSGLTWILHCALPWSFTAAGGPATVSASIGYGITATTAMTFTWSNTNQGATAGTTVVPATTGVLPLFTTPSISSPDTTAAGTSTIVIDGLIASPAAGGSFYLRFTTSAGTAQINAGGYCRIE